MSAELILKVAARWAHVLSAVVLVGGVLFYGIALLPACRKVLPAEQRTSLLSSVVARWKRLVHVTVALLLVSGLYNFFVFGVPKGRVVAGYHGWFGLKFVLALAVFVLASVLAGNAKAFAPLREGAGRWYVITALLGIGVILISGVLRSLG